MIVDAGPLYAYIDADDRHHSASLELLRTHRGPLVVPTLVVTEVSYLVGTRLGSEAEVRFIGDLEGSCDVANPIPVVLGCEVRFIGDLEGSCDRGTNAPDLMSARLYGW